MSETGPVCRAATVMHVRCPHGVRGETFRRVLEMLADLSAVVQALPPTAALVEAKGALRYHGVDGRGLAEMARLRAAAHLGVDLRIGVASTAALAATASAQAPEPGGLVVVEPEQAHEWLEPLAVCALYGIGERQASDLRHYGVHRVGQLAGLSLHTVQRILGARAGRLAWERSRGIDPRPVTPRALPSSLSLRRRFSRQTLDGAVVRAALLDTVVRLGTELRRRRQITQALTLALEFASGRPLARTRRRHPHTRTTCARPSTESWTPRRCSGLC